MRHLFIINPAAGKRGSTARLEERLAQGVPVAPVPQTSVGPAPRGGTASQPTSGPPKAAAPADDDHPPWEEERPPLPEEPPEEPEYVFDAPAPEPVPETAPRRGPASKPPEQPAPAAQPGGDSAFWPSFAAGLRGKVPPTVMPYLNNPAKVTGAWKNGKLTLWVDSEFTRSMLNKPAVLDKLAQAAAAAFGGQPQVSVAVGTPPPV